MYRYRSRRKKTLIQRLTRRYGGALLLATAGVASASFGFLGPASSDVDTNTRVFSEGLSIKLDRGSPAYAALEDTWFSSRLSKGDAIPTARSVSAERLGAGLDTGSALAEKVIRDNRREEALIAQERVSRHSNSQIMAQAAGQWLKKMSESLQPKPDLEAAVNPDSSPTEEPVQKISLADLKISREELLGSLFFPIAQSEMTAEKRPVHRKAHNPTPRFAAKNEDKANPLTTTFVEVEKDMNEAENAKPARQVVVAGDLEFADGLALTNPMDRLVVYRDVDGEVVESGAVWIREAQYEIFVEETVGHLVGELRTPYGDVIGRGLVDLSRVSVAKQTHDRRVRGVNLEIRPVPQGISGRVVAESKKNDGIKDAEVVFAGVGLIVKTDSDGRYLEPNLLEGSSLIVRAQRPGYWGTLAFAHAGDNKDIELFADRESSVIQRLISTSKSMADTSGGVARGVIWGRVTYNGKTVAGAKVELMTGEEAAQPVYFNAAMVPDPSLKETSANGLYAFYPVSAGAHAVQVVWRNGRTSEPMIFPTESRTVSRVDIEAARDRLAKVKVFDAFRTDYPLAAEISHLGSDRGFTIDRTGTREIKYAGGPGMLILEAHAGPAYAKTRLALSRDRRFVYFPMIQSTWLHGLQGFIKLNPEPNLGTVVGFVQGNAPYKVSLDGGVSGSSRVVYFNSRGEPTSADYGEPGGGFVIFNVAEGFHTVAVQSSGSLKAYASVTLVERNVVSLISHWIR